MKGLEPWGENNAVYGGPIYLPNFNPVNDSNSMISYFHIGKYIFHHIGYHETGGLSMQCRASHLISLPSWKIVCKY